MKQLISDHTEELKLINGYKPVEHKQTGLTRHIQSSMMDLLKTDKDLKQSDEPLLSGSQRLTQFVYKKTVLAER